jgi:type II secretion system protein G
MIPRVFTLPSGSMSTARRISAFTLMELMTVVTLIAVLAGLTMASFGYVNKKAADSRARAEVSAISAAIDRYQADLGSYPENSSVLYKELVGEGTVNTNTLYFEPADVSRQAQMFMDPWGTPYKYNAGNDGEPRNKGSYDLWAVPPDAKSEADWIHN